MRSRWKSFFFISHLFFTSTEKLNSQIFYNRSILPKNLINQRVEVYNGKKFDSFLVKEFGDLKFRFADFVSTKKRGNIHTAFNKLKKPILKKTK